MNIIILSRNPNLYSTSRLVQAARQLGHTPYVIDHLQCDLVLESGQPQIFYGPGNVRLMHVHACIPRIGASVSFYGSAVVKQLELMGAYTPVRSDSILLARNKLKSLQMLANSGLGFPKTIVSDQIQNPGRSIDFIGGAPCIIKLLEGTHGHGVMLAETKQAAISLIEAINTLNVKFMIQEFIEEAKGTDIRAFVVGGKVVASMKRKAKDGDFRSNLHQGGSAQQIDLTAEQRNCATKAAQILGLGVCGVDILPSKRGPLILEVNPSPGLEGIEKTTKVNVAESIIQYIERKTKYKNERKLNH